MAEGGELQLLDRKRYLYNSLFGSDFEDDSLMRDVEPAVVVDLKQQKEPKERCILRLKVRKIPGTNMYKNLSYQVQEKQADVVQEPKVEAAKRKLHCEERQEKAAGNKITAKPKQVSKYAKKSHGDTVRARIEWRSKHLGVRKSKYLQVHKPNLLMAF